MRVEPASVEQVADVHTVSIIITKKISGGMHYSENSRF